MALRSNDKIYIIICMKVECSKHAIYQPQTIEKRNNFFFIIRIKCFEDGEIQNERKKTIN